MRGRGLRPLLPPQPRPHPPGHQGWEHSPHGEWHRQARRLRQCQHQMPRQQLCWHAVLDGARGDSGHGRGPIRWEG